MEPPAAAVVRSRVVVTGHVQNVTYRDSTRRRAEQEGVTGWVRNTPDGAVEAELEGPGSAVDAVVGWMRTGPALARVEDVDVSAVPPTGDATFEVR